MKKFRDFMSEGLWGDIASFQLGNGKLTKKARQEHQQHVDQFKKEGWMATQTADEGKRLTTSLMRPRFKYDPKTGKKKPNWADFAYLHTHVTGGGKIKHMVDEETTASGEDLVEINDVDEEVAANSMSAQSPSAVADPQNRILLRKKRRINDLNNGVEADPGQSEAERMAERLRRVRKRQMSGAGEGE